MATAIVSKEIEYEIEVEGIDRPLHYTTKRSHYIEDGFLVLLPKDESSNIHIQLCKITMFKIVFTHEGKV